MRDIQRVGPYVDITEARDPLNAALVVKLGIRSDSFQQNVNNGQKTVVAQYFGMVQDCLLAPVHCFKGLKRPLMHGDDKEADKSVIIYSWRPETDYVWTGSQFRGKPLPKLPLPKRVFVVLVREEKQPNSYAHVGKVFGSIE